MENNPLQSSLCVLYYAHTEHNLQIFTKENPSNNKEEQKMSEKEKAILENLSKSLEKATESQKEYLLGLADGMALMAEKKDKE